MDLWKEGRKERRLTPKRKTEVSLETLVQSPLKKACKTPRKQHLHNSSTVAHKIEDREVFLEAVAKSAEETAVPLCSLPKSHPIDNDSDSTSTTISSNESDSSDLDSPNCNSAAVSNVPTKPSSVQTSYGANANIKNPMFPPTATDKKDVTMTPKAEQNKVNMWSHELDSFLFNAVKKHGEGRWEKITSEPGLNIFTPQDVLERWTKVKPNIKGPWKPDEDELLNKYVQTYGTDTWSSIACHIPGRSGKQCRERWKNHLDPDLKKCEWSVEEDDILIQAQKQMGNKWSEIAKKLGGRPENAVKNRFNSLRSRKSPRHVARAQSMPSIDEMENANNFIALNGRGNIYASMPAPERCSAFSTTTRSFSQSARRAPSRILHSTVNFLGNEMRRSLDSCSFEKSKTAKLRRQVKTQMEEILRLRTAISEVLEENLELRQQENENEAKRGSCDDNHHSPTQSPSGEDGGNGNGTPSDAFEKSLRFSPPTIVRKQKAGCGAMLTLPTPFITVVPPEQDFKTASALLTLSTPKNYDR